MSKLFYRCENEFGADPCEFAKANRKIPESEVSLSLSGVNPKCPGKTLSGKTCNSELIPIRVEERWWKKLLAEPRMRIPVIAGAILLLIACIWALFSIFGPGEPLLSAVPNPLVFPLTKGGKVTADITIRNNGNGDLVIDRIEARPPMFSVSGEKVRVDPNGSTKLPVRFESRSNEMVEGELVLHSNDQKSPTFTIKLIANRDPWWVFRKLETTSKILHKEP